MAQPCAPLSTLWAPALSTLWALALSQKPATCLVPRPEAECCAQAAGD